MKTTIGWCEWVALPELGVERIKAKIDTGARTSALHVQALSIVDARQAMRTPLLEIEIPFGRRGGLRRARCEAVDLVRVRASTGSTEWRPVIETLLVLGPHLERVRVTLTDRGDMIFPMLIGRTALGGSLVIDPTARYRLRGR